MLNIIIDNHYLSPQRFALAHIKKADKMRQKFVVIVPEQFSAETERDLLTLLNTDGLIHVEVLSFKRLVHRILTKNGISAIEPLTALGKKMMIAEIVAARSSALKLYQHSDKVKGLLDKLADIIADFRHQTLEPSMLNDLINLTGKTSLLGIKLTELSLIYEGYLERLSPDIVDEDALMQLAIKTLRADTTYSDTTFIIEGFSSMTLNELSFLMALTEQGVESHIRLIGSDDNHPVHKYMVAFIDTLMTKAKEHHIDYKLTHFTTALSPSMQAYRSLFDYDFSGNIALINLPNIEDEIGYVFTDMIKKHIEQGIAWRDMVIVTGDLTRYYAKLSRMAERYRIPVFTDSRRPAATHYAVDFVLSLVRAISGGYRGRDIIKVLKSPMLGIDFELVCHIENYILAHNINGRSLLKPWHNEELQHLIAPVFESIFNLGKNLKNSPSAKDKINLLKTYLDDQGMLVRLSQDIDTYYDDENYIFAEELAQIYNIIDHVLYQIFLLGKDRQLSITEFYDLLVLGFDSYEIGVIPNQKDYVICGNIRRTRIGSVKYIYMMGMTEDAMPSAAKTGELFNDDECAFLSANGIKRLTTQDDDYDEEVYKTYDFISRATCAVIWTRPKMTLDGTVLKPSIWYSQLSDHLTETSMTVDLEQLKSLGAALPFVTHSITAMKRGIRLSDDSLKVLSGLKQNLEIGRYLTAYYRGVAYGLKPLSLSSDLAEQLYHTSLSASISRLESFVKCPYQHFVSYGLKPLILETARLSSLDVGNFYHHLIEYVMNKIKHLPSSEITNTQLKQHLDVAYQNYVQTNYRFMLNDKNIYYSKRLKRVLALTLYNMIEQIKLGEFNNTKNELEFSDNIYADFPALTLEGGLKLRGKIDRIDTAVTESGQRYVRLIDYKSSHQGLSVHDVYYGLKLQLMIYLDVARSYTQAKPYGAFYFAVDEPMIEAIDDIAIDTEMLENFKLSGVFTDNVSVHHAVDHSFKDKRRSDVIGIRAKKSGDLYQSSAIFSEQDLSLMHSYAKTKASSIAKQIFSGDICINPHTDGKVSVCTYCNYKTLCQFDAKKSCFTYGVNPKLEDDEYLQHMRQAQGAPDAVN